MRRAYSLLLYLLVPAVIVYLCWRGWRSPGYWRRWRERFGWVTPLAERPIWVHAVSVGEVQAAIPLIRALRTRFPWQKILVTTLTPTGAQRVQASLAQDVIHCYAPYDLPGVVRRFLARTRPRLALMMETELWPNIAHYCRRADIPLVLANARMSERSARGYRRVARLTKETLEQFSAVAAQTTQDAQRLIDLGASAARVHVTGSIKFDVKLPASLREEAAVLRRLLGVERAVWIAASTREGEEKYVLDAYAMVKQALPHALLVLVPRHPERFAKVAALCHKHGYTTVLRSERRPCDARADVFIGDSMGELLLFYAACDVAFVGGSLVPTGGHNLLEPAALGLAVLSGPFMYNFAEISRMLREAGAAREVRDARELSAAVIEYLGDANLRYAVGERGRRLVEQNQGALQRLLDSIAPYLTSEARETREA